MHMGDAELEAKVDELLKRAKALDPPVQRVDVVDLDDPEAIHLLPTEDICYVTTSKEEAGKKRAIEFHATETKKYAGYGNLSDFVKRVKDDPKFMQVHKSFVVNLKQIVTVKNAESGSGRDLICKDWPDEKVRCSQENVAALEAYYKT
jgi:DNA-binding LytR/AlgR family response regulator